MHGPIKSQEDAIDTSIAGRSYLSIETMGTSRQIESAALMCPLSGWLSELILLCFCKKGPVLDQRLSSTPLSSVSLLKGRGGLT